MRQQMDSKGIPELKQKNGGFLLEASYRVDGPGRRPDNVEDDFHF